MNPTLNGPDVGSLLWFARFHERNRTLVREVIGTGEAIQNKTEDYQ
jgi:hypothetical protein